MRAIPRLLPDGEAAARAGLEALHSMLRPAVRCPKKAPRRMARIEALFGARRARRRRLPMPEQAAE